MCYLQTITYKCGCTSYCVLYTCDLYPDPRDDASDCPLFGNHHQDMTLPYCCPKKYCWPRHCMSDKRDERRFIRLKEESRQHKRDMRIASFKRWEMVWEREDEEARRYGIEKRWEREERSMKEERSQKIRRAEKEIFEQWEQLWAEDEMRGGEGMNCTPAY